MLNLVVRVLADAEDEYSEMVRADFRLIGKLLERAGAGQWTEPEPESWQGAEFEMWGYSGPHTVRRLAVHLAATGQLPPPLEETHRAAEDLAPDSEEVFEAADAETLPDDGWQRYGVESYVCLRLLRGTRLPIDTGAAIAFT